MQKKGFLFQPDPPSPIGAVVRRCSSEVLDIGAERVSPACDDLPQWASTPRGPNQAGPKLWRRHAIQPLCFRHQLQLNTAKEHGNARMANPRLHGHNDRRARRDAHASVTVALIQSRRWCSRGRSTSIRLRRRSLDLRVCAPTEFAARTALFRPKVSRSPVRQRRYF